MRKKNDGKGRMGGRAAGQTNRVTSEMRIWLQGLIDQNREALEADLKALEPMQKWTVIDRLMNYCIPKMSSIDAGISFNDLTEEQLDLIISKMMEGINDGN